MRKMLFLITAVLLASVGAAEAQSFSVGPQLGLYHTSDADNDFNAMFGAAARFRVMPVLGGEVSINYRQEKYFNDDLTVRSWPVMVTGMLYPVPMVYGAVGFGWYNTTFDFSSTINDAGTPDKTKQKVGWHFGGGLELPLGTRASLTGDIRWVFLDYDFSTPPGFGDVDADFYVITAGLLFRL